MSLTVAIKHFTNRDFKILLTVTTKNITKSFNKNFINSYNNKLN